jgi:selenide, water dikinase
LLAKLPKVEDPNLLVGFDTSDDAGVYRLSDDQAIVVTADIITPPVDDPFTFGQIAAANSLSDVYAMGGRPITCLNLAGFPSKELDEEVLHGIVEGALSKITEAGAVLAGGHTTEDEEPKFGLSVTGLVHPDHYWANAGAKPGDLLVLTKRIGSGVLFNANLRGWVSDTALATCIETITTLNRQAAELADGLPIHAATDITGFGLAGHTMEMALGSNVTIDLHASEIPVLPEALEMYQKGVTTGVNSENRALIEPDTSFDASIGSAQQELFVDPQTSGGILFSLPRDDAKTLLSKLHDGGLDHATIVGEVTERGSQALKFI